MLAPGVVHAIARGHGDGEEVHARIERRASKLRALDVAGGEHARKQDRQLRVGPMELEVEIVDAEDRKRECVGRIDRHAHGHGACALGRPIADDAGVAVLDVVPEPAIGLAVHDAIALSRLVPRTLEAFRVHVEVGEHDALLDEQVAPGDEHDLPRGEPVNRNTGRLPIDATGA